MDIFGRYFSARDQNLINAVNNELKNNIVETSVILFKIAPLETNTNIYGEAKASEGKSFYNGVVIYCHMERSELENDDTEIGSDRLQDLTFSFLEDDLKSAGFYPESGDLIQFNQRYYEIDSVSNDKQLLGNQPDKNLSFIVKTHYTRLSSITLVNRQA
jgi:hypothetical protein